MLTVVPQTPAPPNGVLLRPLAYRWFRGPARRDRDVIRMDGRQAEPYEPEESPRVGIELARVRTPDDAIAFVARFGVLNQPTVFEGESCPLDVQQPFADFERAAHDLHRVLRVVLDVRKAAAGDEPALARMRTDFAPVNPDADVRWQFSRRTAKARDVYPPEYFADDDRAILVRASTWAAGRLSNRLVNTRAYVFEPAQYFADPATVPGHLRLGLIGPTLLDFCYITAAHAIAREPLAVCEECHRVFVVDDKRQRYCEPACASRARFRRFKTKQAAAPIRKRSRHGKAARARRR